THKWCANVPQIRYANIAELNSKTNNVYFPDWKFLWYRLEKLFLHPFLPRLPSTVLQCPHSMDHHKDSQIPWRDKPPLLYWFFVKYLEYHPKQSPIARWFYAYYAFGNFRKLKRDIPNNLFPGIARHLPLPSH